MTQPYSYRDIASLIDYAILSPAATVAELEAGCLLARKYEVASVCLLPYYLKCCAEQLRGSGVQPSTTIGFPHSAQATSTKINHGGKIGHSSKVESALPFYVLPIAIK